MTVDPEDLVNRLMKGKKAADRGETIDVTNWTQEQDRRTVFHGPGEIEKLVRIAATEGVEAALEHLDGTPEEDDEVHSGCAESPGRR